MKFLLVTLADVGYLQATIEVSFFKCGRDIFRKTRCCWRKPKYILNNSKYPKQARNVEDEGKSMPTLEVNDIQKYALLQFTFPDYSTLILVLAFY